MKLTLPLSSSEKAVEINPRLRASTELLVSSYPDSTCLLGSGAPSPHPSFDPACLLTIPRLSNTWLTDNVPTGLADRTFAKRLKDIPVLVSNIAKADTWWANQPADAVETIQKVAVMMGIPVCLLQKNFNASNLIKVLTVAINMTNWLDQFLRKKLKHRVLQSYLHLLHTMI